MCRQASDCDVEWRVATVMLKGESQVEGRKSIMQSFIKVGYSSEGISNHEQTRLMSWSTDGGLRGYHLARNPGLSFIISGRSISPFQRISRPQKCRLELIGSSAADERKVPGYYESEKRSREDPK